MRRRKATPTAHAPIDALVVGVKQRPPLVLAEEYYDKEQTMNAGDTVMSQEQIVTCLRKVAEYTAKKAAVAISTAQAEVSFQAGQEQGFRAGVYAGRKEVVEWLKAQIDDKPYQFLGCYITKWSKTDEPTLALTNFHKDEEWQAKLKEWGLE